MRRFLGLILFALISSTAFAAPIVVLVPGFFNSLAPGSLQGPYFSGTIVGTLKKRAPVFVVRNLVPFAGVEENGRILSDYLVSLNQRYPNEKIVLIAHSAGGFYALHALTAHPELPVAAVVTLATPYDGSEFIENLTTDFPGIRKLTKFLNLSSLEEFRPANTAQILRKYYVPQSVRWIAVGGSQPECNLLNCADAGHLSWLLSLTQRLMSTESDGIVTLESALGRETSLLHADGTTFEMERWSDLNVGLEHWEMVQDSNLFRLIGVLNTGYISQRQKQVYNELLDRLGYF